MRDPLPFQLRTCRAAAGHEQQARIRAALWAKEVFGSDLLWDARFMHALVEGYRSLFLRGANAVAAQANL